MLFIRRKAFVAFAFGLQLASFFFPSTIIPINYSKQAKSYIQKHHLYYPVSQIPYSSDLDEALQQPTIDLEILTYFFKYPDIPFKQLQALIPPLKEKYSSFDLSILLQNLPLTDLQLLSEIRTIDQLSTWITIPSFELKKFARYFWLQQLHPSWSKEQICLVVSQNKDSIHNEPLDFSKFYQEMQQSIHHTDITALVNKQFFLPYDYIPSDLIFLPSKYEQNHQPLRQEAALAMIRMLQQANKEGFMIQAASNYRSFELQEYLYRKYTNLYGKKVADSISCRPGHSEHQTGLTSDLSETGKQLENFESAKGYSWIVEHAYKFGFIQRYPKGKEFITGIDFEAWHFRYVGVKSAKIIQENQWTLEEYHFFFST